jgi:hypothetical protein
MRYGIKTHGVIYVAPADMRDALVTEVFKRHGQYRDRGELVVGGWWNLVESVNESVLDLLRQDYEVVEIGEAT